MSRELVLYGICGADESYKVARWSILRDRNKARKNVDFERDMMLLEYPSIESFFIIENSIELRDIIKKLLKCGVRNVASNVQFKVYLEEMGMTVDEYLKG